jgi:hypothetical protein
VTKQDISRSELLNAFRGVLQPDNFKDYGPNGLQVEGRERISHIVSGVTASRALIDAAIDAKADAIFVHHGLFWRGQDGTVTGVGEGDATLKYRISSGEGCSAEVTKLVTVSAIPSKPEIINGSSSLTFCEGGSALLYTLSGGTNQWFKDGVDNLKFAVIIGRHTKIFPEKYKEDALTTIIIDDYENLEDLREQILEQRERRFQRQKVAH